MYSIFSAKTSCVDIRASHIADASLVPVARIRKIIQLFAVALGAASLAACAQSSVVTRNSEHTGMRSTSIAGTQSNDIILDEQACGVGKKHTPFASGKNAAETQVASHGLASFYTEGTKTANGERFDTHELTAAHRTLPFGTQLRVTNVATGRSVTVRINDRGPFIPGRIVDVSHAAAETLGMVRGGIAKVNLDVVQ